MKVKKLERLERKKESLNVKIKTMMKILKFLNNYK